MPEVNRSNQPRVLFVCLGNICRSPTAHGVFQHIVEQRGLSAAITVDSCGTGQWHVGEPPDGRATAEAAKRGYDLSELRARQLCATDYDFFDYILAMDHSNLTEIQQQCPADYPGQLRLFLSYASHSEVLEVPDPYYGGDQGFSEVLDLVEQASEGLLDAVCREWSL
ncbi:MAG: protein-tyrosine phosphatase [Halioglobus sp.]|jgi:protein-tyrosine phosphatase